MYTGRGYDMKIIAICNQKGGIGKTTTATNLAFGLQKRGKRVLLVDCDPQRNSSDTYRADLSDGAPTLADLLYTNDPAESCIQHTEYGDILAADKMLEDADKYLRGVSGFYKLRNRLREVADQYDHIIIDTPPALNLMLQNALIAAEGVIVPITAGKYPLQGLSDFWDTVKDVQSQPNPELTILGILLVKYKKRSVLTRDILRDLPPVTQMLNTTLFKTKIRDREEVEKAQAARMPVSVWRENGDAAADYAALISELSKRGVI